MNPIARSRSTAAACAASVFVLAAITLSSGGAGAVTPGFSVATAPAFGGPPIVRSFQANGQVFTDQIEVYFHDDLSGVSVAAGDVSGDANPDIITGPGPGNGPHVKAFDAATKTQLASFFAFPAEFRGGVNVAAGDFTGDSVADYVTAAGITGGPHVKVFDGDTGAAIASFFAYNASFRGGVNVGAGDVNGDTVADIITAPAILGGPHVKVFDGATGAAIASFFAYNESFRGGVSVAAGDVNNDGKADIITGAGVTGGPHVKVFDGATGELIASFLAYNSSFRGGVNVGSSDLNGDGFADIVTGAGLGGGPHVKAFDGKTGQLLLSFFAYNADFRGGIRVAGAPSIS